MACGVTRLWEFTWHHSALPVLLHEKLLEDSDIRNGKSGLFYFLSLPVATPRAIAVASYYCPRDRPNFARFQLLS